MVQSNTADKNRGKEISDRIGRRVTDNENMPTPELESVQLTQCQIVVMCLCCTGAKSSAIADFLCVSTRTVEFHLMRIYQKLEVDSKLGAAMVMARLGILDMQRLMWATTFAEALEMGLGITVENLNDKRCDFNAKLVNRNKLISAR